MQKVLILGAKGNLGGQLFKIFENNPNYTVSGWDKTNINILDTKKAEKKITKLSPDIIINAIAYNNVDGCENDASELELANRLNGETPGFLAEICSKINATLIHYSTDYVFSGESLMGYTETDRPNPINNYGKSKYLGEKEIAKIALKNPNLKWYIIRTSKLFGPKGESKMTKPSFFDIIINLSKTKDRIEIVNEERSCFTYTKDLATATKGLIEKEKNSGIYHIVNAKSATWHEAVLILFEILNIKTKVAPISADKFSRPAKRPKLGTLLTTKTKPLRSYEEALKDYLK